MVMASTFLSLLRDCEHDFTRRGMMRESCAGEGSQYFSSLLLPPRLPRCVLVFLLLPSASLSRPRLVEAPAADGAAPSHDGRDIGVLPLKNWWALGTVDRDEMAM